MRDVINNTLHDIQTTAPVRRERFSYVILHRGDIAEQDTDGLDLKSYPRIVSYKTGNPVHDLCSSDGTVTRYHMETEDRSLKRFMRHCQPGDFMPVVPITDDDCRHDDDAIDSICDR